MYLKKKHRIYQIFSGVRELITGNVKFKLGREERVEKDLSA
jgi:hypothetical protein